jgi:hypothetical protein
LSLKFIILLCISFLPTLRKGSANRSLATLIVLIRSSGQSKWCSGPVALDCIFYIIFHFQRYTVIIWLFVLMSISTAVYWDGYNKGFIYHDLNFICK